MTYQHSLVAASRHLYLISAWGRGGEWSVALCGCLVCVRQWAPSAHRTGSLVDRRAHLDTSDRGKLLPVPVHSTEWSGRVSGNCVSGPVIITVFCDKNHSKSSQKQLFNSVLIQHVSARQAIIRLVKSESVCSQLYGNGKLTSLRRLCCMLRKGASVRMGIR